jgi:hypothetical protein
MSLVPFEVAKPINFDPGIPGFVKAARHYTGSCLVMTSYEVGDEDWVGLFWVKQLRHDAWHHTPQCVRLLSENTIAAVERMFQYSLVSGPPWFAIRDLQRQRVYGWQEDVIFPRNDKPMPWHGCILFAKYVWERVGTGKPLQLTFEGRSSYAWAADGTVYIPEHDLRYHTKPIILHEIAHEMVDYAAHGPAFVSTYIGLCERFLGLDRKTLEVAADQYHVDYLS